MIAKMTRFFSISLTVFVVLACVWGCPRRQAGGSPASPVVNPSSAPAGDALAAAVVSAVAAQLDLAHDQVLWDAPIARQPKVGDDVDLQELLNRLNEELAKDCTMESLRSAANAPAEQELSGVITPQMLAESLAKAPPRNTIPIPNPNTAGEIPAQPE
jgi:hypothetical protein